MRTTLLFLAGVVAAMGLTRATVAFASCLQPTESAAIHLVSATLDGVPTTYPEGFPPLDYELYALSNGVQISMLDHEGYEVGRESYQRKVR